VTTTGSANATPTSTGAVVVQPSERVVSRVPAAVRAERRAWVILWVAFATFCALVFATVKFTVEYVTTAEVDQSARVTESRGLVIVDTPGNADRTLLGSRTDLGVGTLVTLDRSSVASADLDLFDDSHITVLGGGSVELTRMEVGRFINQQSLMLTQMSGPIRYMTGGPIDIVVPNGQVKLGPQGDYTVWLDGDTTRVLVYGGEARVSASGSSVTVSDGRMAEIDPAHQVHAPVARAISLLTNADFAQHDQNWEAWDRPNSSLDVNGSRLWVAPDDPQISGSVLRVVRDSAKGEHGETGLVQKLDRDVSGFRHLWLEALVRVDYADLPGGGTLGSEYPMMLQVKYEGPVEGSRPLWAVGFYYSNPDNRVVPEWLGQLWPQSEWRKYRVDLMDTETSSMPYHLLELAVMGQGHSYDARIADISLTGE
jgi:hypothetical protein